MRKILVLMTVLMVMFVSTVSADVCKLPKGVEFWLYSGPGTLIPAISSELQYVTILTEKIFNNKESKDHGRTIVTFEATGLFYICPEHGREQIRGLTIGIAFKGDLINCRK